MMQDNYAYKSALVMMHPSKSSPKENKKRYSGFKTLRLTAICK